MVATPLPQSLHITGSVADWESWTGMVFPESGDYIFPEGLAPVRIDRESDLGGLLGAERLDRASGGAAYGIRVTAPSVAHEARHRDRAQRGRRQLVDALLEGEFRATRLHSSGGFLKQGNATILVGVEDGQVEAVLQLIRPTATPASSS